MLISPSNWCSWDPQSSGLGYIIERGVNGAETLRPEGFQSETLDMARLLGRTPSDQSKAAFFGKQQKPESKPGEEHESKGEDKKKEEKTWRGSGLGTDWDDKVGAGAAAASIVSTSWYRSNFSVIPHLLVVLDWSIGLFCLENSSRRSKACECIILTCCCRGCVE